VSLGGSVVAVNYGEQISQYQALQALLLPSANNMADSLAVWAFGSLDAYNTYANNLAKTLGMDNTHIADASGFSDQTTSTARDLVILGQAAMQNEVLAEIVGQSSATIPVAGLVANVNTLLGNSGIIGIKTGNTDAAGGCYLAAATHTFANGQKLILIAAVMGAKNLNGAMSSALPLLDSAYKGFESTVVVHAGVQLGEYRFPWGAKVAVTAAKDVGAFAWRGTKLSPEITLNPVSFDTAKGSQVGSVKVPSPYEQKSVPITLEQTINKPSFWWRLLRI
jgi:D-alanyl-D-alanine carboxypeptidase (penicillin-binding protein 5/6)